MHIQASYSADVILPGSSSKHRLLVINLASVPGRQLVNSPTAQSPDRWALFMETLRYSYIIFLLILFTSCKLTEKSIPGKWVSNYSDTLSINNDHTFLLVHKTGYHLKNDGTPMYDTSIALYSGTWTISNKFLKMNFTEGSGKEMFGGCEGLKKRTKWFSKYTLLRFKTCRSPTFDFVTFSQKK